MKLFNKYKSVLTPQDKKQRKKERILALTSGIFIGIAFPPLPFPYLIFFALIPYLYVLNKRETLTEINRITYLTAFVFTLITLYWVGSWTKEADPFLMISGILLMFVNPALYLIPSTLFYFAKKSIGKNAAFFIFPFFWVSFEFAYSLTDLRFPWLTLSNSLPKFNLFIQIADIVGAYGISLIILFINLFTFLFINEISSSRKLRKTYFAFALGLFFIPIIYGFIRIKTYKVSEEKVKVGLIQPNFNPWDKWEAGNVNEQLDLYLNMSSEAVKKNAKVIVWPESALPVYLFSGNYPYEVQRIHEFSDSNDVFVLTGMPDVQFFFDEKEAPSDAKVSKISKTKYVSYNSILLFSPQSRTVQKYGKIKLVPFGEHVPFVEHLPFLGDLIKWQVGISSWNVGKEQTVFNLIEGIELNIAGVVCIESIYPDFVAGFVQKGANLIAVVTNDSWYGYSSGPFQHKEISAIRAIENRRSVVRSANGGVSCLIDPLGRTLQSTKLFERDILVVDAPIENRMTFYSKFPLTIPLISSFISIFIITLYYYCKLFKKHSLK
ncbi:MAG: apolipoprotein N-acyltransferase [Ignavibacteria bacterium]|nr:apolipoprotein N-acyltransferase [Ignavibacteria bacterium]